MRLGFASFAAALVCLVVLPFTFAPAAAGALRLNEFCAGPARDWNGSGAFSSRDDEWVEVVNTGATPLDLTGYFITDGDSIPRYGFSGKLAAGDRKLVFGSDAVDWERANGQPVFGFSLGNSGDAVILWRVAGADSVVEDDYTFKSHEAAADRAVGRLPDGTGVWTLLDSLDPYTGTLTPPASGCVPTPGAINVCDPTPTSRATWGEVKTRYR